VERKLEKNMVKQELMVLSQVATLVVAVMLVVERNLFHQEMKEAGEGIRDIKDKKRIKLKSYGALPVDRKICGVVMIIFKRMMTFMGSSHKKKKEHPDLETGVGTVEVGETGKGLKGRTR
jgi:hypothetical protein